MQPFYPMIFTCAFWFSVRSCHAAAVRQSYVPHFLASVMCSSSIRFAFNFLCIFSCRYARVTEWYTICDLVCTRVVCEPWGVVCMQRIERVSLPVYTGIWRMADVREAFFPSSRRHFLWRRVVFLSELREIDYTVVQKLCVHNVYPLGAFADVTIKSAETRWLGTTGARLWILRRQRGRLAVLRKTLV